MKLKKRTRPSKTFPHEAEKVLRPWELMFAPDHTGYPAYVYTKKRGYILLQHDNDYHLEHLRRRGEDEGKTQTIPYFALLTEITNRKNSGSWKPEAHPQTEHGAAA